MPQNLNVSDVPARPATPSDDDIDLTSGIVKGDPQLWGRRIKSEPPSGLPAANTRQSTSPAGPSTQPEDIDLSAGIVPRRSRATGKPVPKESDSLWNRAWTGLDTPEQVSKAITFGLPIPKPGEYAKQAEKYRSEGRTGAAALTDLEGYVSSMYQTAGEIGSSLTSPAQLGLMALTAGGSEAEQAGMKILASVAKSPGKVAGLWFGAQGLKIAATPQQEGENKYDAFWRRNLGLSAFLGTVHESIASAKGRYQSFLKNHFQLTDDLAGKVSSQVQQINDIRKRTSADVSKIDDETRKAIRDVQDSLQENLSETHRATSTRVNGILSQSEQVIEQGKGKITELQAERLRQGARTVADTMQAFLQEKARVSKPFDDIAEKIKGSVASDTDVIGIVRKAFKDNGVDEAQIPPRAVELLDETREFGGPITMRSPDGHYVAVGRQDVAGLLHEGYEQVALLSSTEGGVNFGQLTRIREDVSQAARSAKDTRVKASLLKSYDDLTEFQEKIAQNNGQGKEYKIAKDNYKMFKRGIGSDLVDTFLDASDAEEQAIGPKIAAMTTRENAEALRTVLKASGVNTAPLDQVIRDMELVDKQISETKRLASTMVSEQRKSGAAAASALKSEARQEVTEKRRAGTAEARAVTKAGERAIADIKKEPVVPGQDVENLQDKTNLQLLEARLRQQMTTAHSGGFVNTWAVTSIIYGLLETVRGSAFGPVMLTKGYLLLKIPGLMKERKFQDWVIRQSGMEPASPQGTRLRKGIIAMEPVLRKALKSGVPQAAAVKAAQGLSVRDMPQ